MRCNAVVVGYSQLSQKIPTLCHVPNCVLDCVLPVCKGVFCIPDDSGVRT
jgi:hypothetical protein